MHPIRHSQIYILPHHHYPTSSDLLSSFTFCQKECNKNINYAHLINQVFGNFLLLKVDILSFLIYGICWYSFIEYTVIFIIVSGFPLSRFFL